MRSQALLSPFQKLLFVLAVLTVVLSSLSSPAVKNAEARICCSACDFDNPTPPCRHGCSPSC